MKNHLPVFRSTVIIVLLIALITTSTANAAP